MKNIEAFFKRIWRIINKDVSFEDESSQFYVMMRVYYMITAVYILMFDILMLVTGLWKYVPIMFIWLPLHIISFFTTYRYRRRAVFHIFSVGILTWIVLAVHLMGWGYGAQNFIYPLIVISFFATYKNYWGKACYVSILCIIYIALFYYSGAHTPVMPQSEILRSGLYAVTIIMIFLCMFVICLMFSNTNQSALEKLASYSKKLKQEAETDTLTGLMNRRSMYKILEERLNLQSEYTFTIAMGDIDFFKTINDTKGHNCGDQVLCSISEYFQKYMENKGTVCRWGGEEFLFLFPELNGDEACVHIMEMKDHLARMPIHYKDEVVHITMTFGVEEYDYMSNITEFIKGADDKLYIGKNSGRNKMIF